MKNILEVKQLVKTFKSDFWKKEKIVLDNISFHLEEGRSVGFLGSNGAGKTTLLKIILGFIFPNSGEVFFHPDWGKKREDIFRHIGYLPERPYFYEDITGREYAHFLAKLQKMKSKERNEAIDFWAPQFQITDALDRKIRTYSKGMLQRLGFMGALLHDPSFIILDEPLSGLDPMGRKKIKEIMLKLKQDGKTLFFSSHIIEDVEEICDDLIYLKDGTINQMRDFHQLLEEQYRDEYEVQYVLQEKWITEIIKKEEKEIFLQNIINQQGSIKSLYPLSKKLESLFYE